MTAIAVRLPRVLQWLENARADAGISFSLGPDAGWNQVSYERIRRAALHSAEYLRANGLKPGDRVVVALPASPEFVSTTFGSWWAGATLAPIAIPLPMQSTERYKTRTAALLECAQPQMLVTLPELRETLEPLCAPLGITVVDAAFDETEIIDSEPAATAAIPFLQFTSGSSGTPRAVRITWENFDSDLAAIDDWLQTDESWLMASWLPLFHDMGFTGGLLFPCVLQLPALLSTPEEFLISPISWIKCFGELGATFGPAPSFAFDYVTKRVSPEELQGMDFSRWKAAVVGAERVDGSVLARFAQLLAPHGFNPASVRPAYGMAEATLAIAGHRKDTPATVLLPDWTAIEQRGDVIALERGKVGDPCEGTGWLVSNGPALRGFQVDIVDDHGVVLGEGKVGEIRVRGGLVADGWIGRDSAGTTTRFSDDTLYTGDNGFFFDGELYVIGRIGDSFKQRGKTLYAEQLEERVSHECELEPRAVAVVMGVRAGRDVVAAITDSTDGEWVELAGKVLRREAGPDVDIEIYGGRMRSIQRTSSGKPRRRVLWDLVRQGNLPVDRILSEQAN